jgi:hypothetical protein
MYSKKILESLIQIRHVQPQDISFIYSTWLKSFKHDSMLGKSLRTGVFFENYREVIDHILSESTVLIACLPEDSNVIIGYLVFQPNIIHYAFIKESFRRLSVCRQLITNAKLDINHCEFTHLTLKITNFIQAYAGLTYNPVLLYKKGLI